MKWAGRQGSLPGELTFYFFGKNMNIIERQSLRLPLADTSTATAMPLPFSALASVGAKRLPQASSALYTREAEPTELRKGSPV